LAEKLFREATADAATFAFFPNLQMLYTIFYRLAASSASAECALSKLRIVKNSLRSGLCDEMLISLLVLASERDVLRYMKTDVSIDKL